MFCFVSAPILLQQSSFLSGSEGRKPLYNTELLSQTGPRIASTCNLSRREQAREDNLRAQQEILARRRNKKKNREYFNAVNERRRQLEEGIQSRRLQVKEGEDPLIAWKKLREEGKIKEIGYEDVPTGGIPMPMPSFGIPRFDNGERFDLRLPHVEHGYTDDNADVMGKLMRFFGFGKKRKENQQQENEKGS